jgi:peptidoglycan/xylan/chitin deacetylase (PgdA/CDA1 family)
MKTLAFLIALVFLSTWAGAQEMLPSVSVAPWNGHKAAISLTFDDSDPSHLDVAIPELNQRGLHGTFFLIVNRTDRKDEWRKALEKGHELGNLTLDHEHPNVLTPDQTESQVEGAQAVLRKTFGIPIYSFAYPYTEITPDLRKWVEQTSFIARGGYGNGNYYMKPESEPDWFNIPSQMTQTNTPFSTYQNWLDQDFQFGAWMVFMIHGLEGTPWGYQPISKKIFEQILDALQARDFWVQTFSGVGAYWKAEKIFEKTQPSESGNERKWTWDLPGNFPAEVALKLELEKNSGSSSAELSQKGRVISPDGQGFYAVQMDAQELTERLSPSH